MREIKFRAWSNDEMKYSKDTVDFTFWKWVAYDSSTHLMQYTGLKDKNGKEVYEGDILDFESHEWGMPGFKSSVEWDTEKAEWCFGGGTSSDVHVFRKVIGNIYENPELLNQ